MGEIPETPQGPGPGSGDACVDRLTGPPIEAHIHVGGNTTNAGVGCLTAGACHKADSPGPNAPGYQFAGTAYKADGVTPQVGVTIRVKSQSGTVAIALTDSAGNFYINAGMLPMAFPATTDGTVCPSTTKMIAPLQQNDGDCNRGGCHSAAGAAGQGPILVMD